MTLDTILTIVGSAGFTSIFAYFTGKRQAKAQTDNQVILNLELAVNVYKKVIDDLKDEIIALNRKIDELEIKIDELHEENKKLKASI